MSGNFKRVGRIYATLIDGCQAVGIVPPRALKPGYTETQAEDDRRGKAAGRVKTFEDGKGCICLNWKSGLMAVVIYGYVEGQKVDRREIERQKAELERARAEEFARVAAEQKKAAAVAAEIVAAAHPVERPHAYLTRKGLDGDAFQLRELGRNQAQWIIDKGGIKQNLTHLSPRLLTVPLVGTGSNGARIVSVQLIDENGAKAFLKSGAVKGALWIPPSLAGKAPPPIVGIAEGVATALSVTHLCGVPCIAAMNAGNLEAASKTAMALFVGSRLAFYADADASGVGEQKALAAWHSLPLWVRYMDANTWAPGVVKPVFTPRDVAAFRALKKSVDAMPTDFNDLQILRGESAKLVIGVNYGE